MIATSWNGQIPETWQMRLRRLAPANAALTAGETKRASRRNLPLGAPGSWTVTETPEPSVYVPELRRLARLTEIRARRVSRRVDVSTEIAEIVLRRA